MCEIDYSEEEVRQILFLASNKNNNAITKYMAKEAIKKMTSPLIFGRITKNQGKTIRFHRPSDIKFAL